MAKRNRSKKDDNDCDLLISMAQFECDIDPYRGIQSLSGPWFESCCVGNKRREAKSNDDDDSDLSQEHIKVMNVVGCKCPSLSLWTKNMDSKRHATAKRKKRKRGQQQQQEQGHVQYLGRRPSGTGSPCDYNPFCLVSLGGVMDDVLAERSKGFKPTNGILEREVFDLESNTTVIELCDSEQSSSDGKNPCAPKHVDSSSEDETETETHKETPSEAFLKEFQFTEDELNPSNQNSIYDASTREQFDEIRKEMTVYIDPIRKYASEMIKTEPKEETVERYLSWLKETHNSMLFTNPLAAPKPVSPDCMKIAVPPGMENLGATCYLNTQLQCLARNLSFLKGILSWSPSEKADERMNNVLSKLQMILARLAYGGESTIRTMEFSKALGLENNEMQDPNEFARLLFERMHESFQLCAGSVNESLADLLPRLFSGVMTNETVCQTCQQTTERNENFMDLNLPIAHRPSASENGQKKIKDASKVTDVQFCLDQYICDEPLTGENQYFCGTCGTKRDALRRVVFKELPPVLNLQLCRYVYDMEKFSKKKLADKVRLPLTLKVPVSGEAKQISYRLCAVMRHIGSSAHSGHYVAEAMDWNTGKWFEFNDDEISCLDDGPQFGFDQDADDFESQKSVSGSQDAYNMYYVKDSYLSKCIMESFDNGGLNGGGGDAELGSIQNVIDERKTRFSMVSEMFSTSGRFAEKIGRRKRGLMCLLRNYLPNQARSILETPENLVWIDGRALYEILACERQSKELNMTDTSKPVIHRGRIGCRHNIGMHPRTARQGKLIPKDLFCELEKLLDLERRYRDINGHVFVGEGKGIADDYITPMDALVCEACRTEFTAELSNKLELTTKFRRIVNEFDDAISLCNGEDQVGDPPVFAVSRTFITRLKSRCRAFLKNLDSVHKAFDGLDSLDPFATLSNGPSTKAGEELDMSVNSNILCKYELCCSTINKNSVRFVNEATWEMITELFPSALRLQRPRSMMNDNTYRCRKCEDTNNEKNVFRDWSNKLFKFEKVLVGRRGHRDALCPADQSNEVLAILRKSSVVRLKQAMQLSSTERDVVILKQKLCSLFVDAISPEITIDEDTQASLKCDHGRLLAPLVFDQKHGENDEGPIWNFSKNVALVRESEYSGLVTSVRKLHALLFDREQDAPEVNHWLQVTIPKFGQVIRDVHEGSQHSWGTEGEDYEIFQSKLGANCIDVAIRPTRCADLDCNEKCVESFKKPQQQAKAKKPESVLICVDEIDDMEAPLPVKNVMQITYYEVAEESLPDAIREICRGVSNGRPASENGFLRRSGRKRKQRFALGAAARQKHVIEMERGQNVAALRLHIVQAFADFRLDSPLILVVPRPDAKECEETAHIELKLPYGWNEKEIETIVSEATVAWELDDPQKKKCMDQVSVVSTFREYFGDSPQRIDDDDQTPELTNEELMEMLLTVANIKDKDPAGETPKKKQRTVERGFTGTFLHSAVSTGR